MGEAGVATLDGFDRSLEQRMTALERANKIRTWRSQMKRDVKARRQAVVPLLLAPPAELESMKVMDLLLAAPKIGRVKAMKMISRAGVSPSKQVGGLSDRQRRELVAFLS